MKITKEWIMSPSRIFTVCAAAFCLGVALGTGWGAPGMWLITAVFCAVGVPIAARRPRARLVCLVLTSLAIGTCRAASVAAAVEPIPYAVVVRVEATVNEEVDQLVTGQRATLSDVRIDGAPYRTRIVSRFELYPRLSADDRVTFRCALKKPEPIEGFAYDRYLASRGVYATCSRPSGLTIAPGPPTLAGLILRFKSWLVTRLDLAVPEPAASFLSGLVFGGNSGLSSDLQDAFSKTGTSHVLAASGSNVSLLTAVFLGWITQTRLGRKRGIALTAVLLAGYVVMAGAVPAVLRAALMAAVLLVGAWLRRKADAANVLLAAVVLMLLPRPLILLYDPGFQLSITATVALLVLSHRWLPRFGWLPEAYEIRSAFVTSLAASVMTLPISLWHFGSVSAVGPIANLLLLPFVPLLVALGLLAFAAAIVPLLGAYVGLPAWAAAGFFLRGEQLLSLVPFAQVSVPHPHVWAAVSALFVGLLTWRTVRSSPA